MASSVRVSNAFHSPGITKILSFAQNGTAPETHSPALMAGLLRTTGFRPAAKAGLIPFCARKRSCSSAAHEKLIQSAQETPYPPPPRRAAKT